ncbi:MAG TPA: cupin domain-containing protein [Dokdonella sp.]
MHPRAAELIDALALHAHPEGGHYRRVHESALRLHTAGGDRAALSAIHYLLAAGEFSRWHRVDADESWHHAEGDPLEIFVFEVETRSLTRHRLGRHDGTEGTNPLVVVPAHHWQAARPLGAYALVGCSVAPGFQFSGFTLLDDAPEVAASIEAADTELAALA